MGLSSSALADASQTLTWKIRARSQDDPVVISYLINRIVNG